MHGNIYEQLAQFNVLNFLFESKGHSLTSPQLRIEYTPCTIKYISTRR